MKSKITDFSKKYYFIFLPVGITIIFLLLGLIKYEINDDLAMLNIAESFRNNSHSEQLVFMSVIYGYALKLLYHIIPQISWFSVLQLAVFDLAFITLFSVIKKYKAGAAGITLMALFEAFFLLNFTFTSISFLCLAGAMLYYMANVKELKRENLPKIIYTAVLFFLAFAMRSGGTFKFIVAIFSAFVFFAVVQKRNRLSAVALVLVICAAANYSVFGVQKYYNSKIPDEMYFNQFQEYRSSVTDGFIDYEKHSEELSEKGVSENDYNMIKHWMFADKTAFSAEAFKSITEAGEFSESHNTDAGDIIQRIIDSEITFSFLIGMLCVSAAALLVLKKRRLEAPATAGIVCALIGYLQFVRRAVARICCPVIIIGIIIMLVVFLQEKEALSELKPVKKLGKRRVMSVFCVILIGAFLFSFARYIPLYNEENKPGTESAEVVQYIKENPEITFTGDYRAIDGYKVDKLNVSLLRRDGGSDLYTFSLGGWNIYSYAWYADLQSKGLSEYSDSLISLVLNDGVLFVSRNGYSKPGMITEFFKEHYNLNVGYSIVKEFSEAKVTVYDFYVENE